MDLTYLQTEDTLPPGRRAHVKEILDVSTRRGLGTRARHTEHRLHARAIILPSTSFLNDSHFSTIWPEMISK